MGVLAGGVVAGQGNPWRLAMARGQITGPAALQYDIAAGPFEPRWKSLERNYQLPAACR
jgi:hypothetical protein